MGDTDPFTLYTTYFNPPTRQGNGGPTYATAFGFNFLYIPYDNLTGGGTSPGYTFWRYSLPYTLKTNEPKSSRVFLNGYNVTGVSGALFNFNDTSLTTNIPYKNNGQTVPRIPSFDSSNNPNRGYLQEVLTGGPYPQQSETLNPFYHDAYKLISLSPGLSMYNQTQNPFQSAIYSGAAMDVDSLFLVQIQKTQ